AIGTFREVSTPFELAVTLLEYGEWLIGESRADEAAPLVGEAVEIFARLEATPWLDRASRTGVAEVEADYAAAGASGSD
ncbi:MAG TPA: hypothetical protein VEH52_03320, partial [Gaiellaceae bacterium]|nr:hypothetical protein [Gaiellaceae bacterium]